MNTLLKNFEIVTSSNSPPIEHGSLMVRGGVIDEIYKTSSPDVEDKIDEKIDGRGRLLLPGFVNSHTHLGMTIFRGYAEDLNLQDWLENWIWPAEENLTAEEVYWGASLAAVESIRAGVTTVADMYFHMDQTARAIEEAGIRGLISYGVIADEMDSTGEKEVKRAVDLIDNWEDEANGRLKVALSPHAPYTCGEDVLKELSRLASDKGVPIHTHVAETKEEVERSLQEYGASPVARLESLGVLENDAMAAHCVHVSDEDITILSDYDVFVLHNPTSNAKLASGVAPVKKLRNAGVKVGLATDGTASNNDLSMINEMKTAALLGKLTGKDPKNLPVHDVYRMAVAEDVSSFSLEKLGAIKKGFFADLIAIDRDAVHWVPDYDSLSNLVYSAKSSDVSMVMVDGKILMKDGEITTVDEQEIKAKFGEIAEKYGEIRENKINLT